MTPDDVRAAAEQLVQFHERFAPLFGKEQAQDHAYDYVKGLMICPDRKSIEPIALLVGHGDVSGLQKFVNCAPWQYDDVQAEVQAAFDDELVPSAAGSPVGVVGVIDESAFAKKGVHSAGVARQHNGRLGKEDNCQVGVFLVGVTPAGAALLDHRLYLPKPWCEDTPEARGAAGEGPHPRGRDLPAQGADRRRVGPRRRGARPDDPGLGRRRRGVRQGGALPRRDGRTGAAVRRRGAGHDHRLDRGPGGVRPCRPGHEGECRRHRRGRACSRWPRWPRACPPGRGRR